MCIKILQPERVADLIISDIESESLKKEEWEILQFDINKHMSELENIFEIPEMLRGKDLNYPKVLERLDKDTEAINRYLKDHYKKRIEEEILQALLERAGKAVLNMFGENKILDIAKVELQINYPRIIGCYSNGIMVLQLNGNIDY